MCKTFRQRLKVLCKVAELTRPEPELARLTRLSRPLLYDLLREDRPNLSFNTVYELATTFGVSLAWLGAGAGKPFRGIDHLCTSRELKRARARVMRSIQQRRQDMQGKE